MAEADPRTEADICGETMIGDTGIEWICIKKPHAAVYMRRAGGVRFQDNGAANKHYMVPRFPNRKDDSDSRSDG